MNRKYGPIFAALGKDSRGQRPERVARDLARELLIDCKMGVPPFDPFECAKLLGVPIEYAAIEAEGIFAGYPARNPKIILPFSTTNSSQAKRRRLKFTLAHEIGHYVIRRKLEGSIPVSAFVSDDPEEEFLCSVFASELLMPSSMVIPELHALGVSPDALCSLAERYDVSLQSMLCRMTDIWKGVVIAALWKRRESRTELNWISPRKYRSQVLRQMYLRDTSQTSVERAFVEGGLHTGRDHFLLNGVGMWWHTSSLRLPPSGLVLSVMQRDTKQARKMKLPKFVHSNPATQQLSTLPVQQFLPYPLSEPVYAARKSPKDLSRGS